jgi:class 3 adenylate cyclase
VAVPLWALFVGLHVWQAARGHPLWPPLVTAAPADVSAYPVVRELRPGSDLGGIAPGDRLLRAGALDLRGVGPVGVGVRLLEQSEGGRVRVAIERAGAEREVEIALPAARYPWWRGLVLGIGLVAPALLVLLRAPGTWPRDFVFGSICYTLVWSPVAGGAHELSYLGLTVHAVASVLVGPFILRASQLFPLEVPLRGRWHAAWAWAFALGGLFRIATLLGTPLSYEQGARGLALYQLAVIGVLIALLARAYRISSPLGRRQIKWVLYSVYMGAVPFIVANAIDAFLPGQLDLRELAVLSAISLPVGIVLAIVRSQLFDIDRLISATASYSATLAVLFAVALLLVNRVASALSQLSGADPSSLQTGLAFVLALAVVPAQRTLRPRIESFFFGERRALEEGVESLLRALSSCEGPQALLERLGEWLDRLLRPENCVIYARDRDAYVPVFVQARAAPPAFGAEGELARWLRARTGAAELDASRRRGTAQLDPGERAALATLGSAVLLPIQRAGELAAFVCLGAKRSGDVYTPTDLSLLTAVADKTSSELQRFGEAEVLRQGREMQEALRRYVPGAIAEQLASGRDLTPREREVAVLFVDIRGYTALSQERRAEDIFSTVNRYTETVSRLVREHGGSVVEFNGDGMMAVFGAPEELPGKERAALRAGRAIVAAVAEITPEGGKEVSASGLTVGVGIATGPAFVGNIRAVDRLIWSAIGNTTNLAARLQSLTRELDAAIVIDAATARAAGDALDGLTSRVAVPVRGRSEPLDLFMQPMARREE